jgi:hypothetical protein
MAVIPYDKKEIDVGIWRVKWVGIKQSDTMEPFPCPPVAEKSVQVTGTFGAAGTVTVEGSNWDPGESTPLFGPLTDPQANAISFTTAKIEAVLENTSLIKPVLAGGDGTTLLAVRMWMTLR